jgi:hypothetical protein
MPLHFDGQWREAAYCDLIRERTGIANWFELHRDEKLAHCKKFDIDGGNLKISPLTATFSKNWWSRRCSSLESFARLPN